MPKDATKNVNSYKIRGGQLNEFELSENQEALAQQKAKSRAKLIPGTPPEQKAEGLRPVVKAAAKKSTKKAARSTKNSSSRSASAKKLAARRAAKK